MLLRHLRYLLAVAEHRNFTRAAEVLHVSQPTLSQQVRQLEEQLRVQLLDRSGRSVRPTDAGELYLLHARRALRELEAAQRAIHEVRDLSRGRLRLGMTPTFTCYLVGALVDPFNQRYPGIELSLEELPQDALEAALIDDRLDLGVAFSEPGSLEIEWNTLTDTAVLGVYTLQQIQAMGLGLWNGVDPTQYARDDGAGNVLRSGVVIGSVNYATGAVQFQPDVTVKIPSPVYGAQRLGWASGVGQMFRLNYGGISYVDAPSMYPNDESGYVKLRYNSAGSTSNHSETFAFSPSFRLVPGVNAQVVTGTVLPATVTGVSSPALRAASYNVATSIRQQRA